MKYFAVMIISLFAFTVSAQENSVKNKVDDAFNELDGNKLTLRFFDALTGRPIPSAKVEILAQSYETDFEGKAMFPAPETDSVYTITFTHPEYISAMFNIEVMAGSLFFNRFSVSPKLPIGTLRVVVDWDTSPRDLDAHLEKVNFYHISFRDMRTSADGSARLDRDDVDGFGPETITAAKIDNGAIYRYFIHDYTNKNSRGDNLSRSKAMVKVYGGGDKLLEVYSIPKDVTGTVWEVFEIRGGKIFPVNTIH
jgi:hypothetical protein